VILERLPMRERSESGGGFSVLDGAAIVTGAAVASVHIRGVNRDGDNLAGPGWLLIWGTFAWVALTAAGPFLFLFRRFLRRLADYPKVGDTLWAVLGLPWLVTAAIRSATPRDPHRREDLIALGLTIGLALACLIALAVVWKRWVLVPPEEASRIASAPWTNRIGLILSVAWPIQCGVGLVIVGPP
jgi:hypothetical protein